MFELPVSGLDAKVTAAVLNLLTSLTTNIESAKDSAFAEYPKRGLGASYGLLGDAYFIGRDKRLSHPTDIAEFAIKQWLVENKFDNDVFLSRVAKSLKTGSVMQSLSANTRPKKAD